MNDRACSCGSQRAAQSECKCAAVVSLVVTPQHCVQGEYRPAPCRLGQLPGRGAHMRHAGTMENFKKAAWSGSAQCCVWRRPLQQSSGQRRRPMVRAQQHPPSAVPHAWPQAGADLHGALQSHGQALAADSQVWIARQSFIVSCTSNLVSAACIHAGTITHHDQGRLREYYSKLRQARLAVQGECLPRHACTGLTSDHGCADWPAARRLHGPQCIQLQVRTGMLAHTWPLECAVTRASCLAVLQFRRYC